MEKITILIVAIFMNNTEIKSTKPVIRRILYNTTTNTNTILTTSNCYYILFTKLPWPGDSEGTFRSSSQAATCPPVYHTRRRLLAVPLIAERQAGKL